jgi:serine phosphatase RsbU (regulator of sigma subunit)
MTATSITSTDSFAARAQHSEARRVALWLVVFFGLAAITIARRVTGGAAMYQNPLFLPYTGVLGLAIVVQIVLLSVLRPANRRRYLLPWWVSRAAAIFDLFVVASLLVITGFLSPRGPIAALTAPPILLVPLLPLMSVLRLRPNWTLGTGSVLVLVQLLLTIRAIHATAALPEARAVYFVYCGLLALIVIAAVEVSQAMRGHVREAAAEAAAHERADREVFRMNHDLAIARDIQQGLLPRRAPQLAGFEIIGMNRPADQTGGDYYDWQELPDGRLAVVLADVSGHGIGPAIVMAVCRAYARSTAPTVRDPAAMLSRLNELIGDDLPSDRFITLVVAVLASDGSVQLISAGHGPTLLYRAREETVTEFDGDGVPLGVIPGEQYGPTQSLTLDEGDVLMMLTDGFFEWSRPGDGEAFGIPRLEQALRAAASADASTILRCIDESVRRFCNGSPQSDDMTAIVIKRRRNQTAPPEAAEVHRA